MTQENNEAWFFSRVQNEWPNPVAGRLIGGTFAKRLHSASFEKF
jgi:hypothetical protein